MAKRQLRIKGTEGPTITEVNEAAEEYVKARDARMKLTEKEVESKEVLLTVMKKHKLTIYRDADATPELIVEVTPGPEKVKVKTAKEEDPDDETEETDAA